MGDKLKELCKWKTESYSKDLATLKKIVADPCFVCVKCGRAADRKKLLCKPEKI